MPVPESEVLKPVDPSITDSDEWEIFILNDAYVVYESNGKLASLLKAFADTPLKVVGRLEAPARGQHKYYLQKPAKPVEIEIGNVMRFSYGELTDGDYALWAQGKAGWFEIRPAPKYQKIYNDMIQAVELLYFVTDIYNEPRKRGGGPNHQLIFQEYAEDERFSCTDPTIASQIFHQHRIFLMMCFLNRAQGMGWSNTPLYQYFRRQFPEDLNTCKARIEGRHQAAPGAQTRSKSTPVPTKSSPPTAATQSRKGRGSNATLKTSEAPKKDNNWWEAATLFEFMQIAVNQRVMRAGRNQITLERVGQLLVRKYEIEELETAINVLLVHAQNLCYMMDHPRRKVVRFFADEPIYQELIDGHNLSAAEQRRAEVVELKPRRDHARLKDEESESSDTSEEDENDLRTPVRIAPGRRKKGRLSVLRPKSGKFSGKRKGPGKAPPPKATISDDSSDVGDSDQPTESEDAMNIDTPTHNSTSGHEKRKHNQTGVDMNGDHKRPRTASDSKTPESPTSTIGSEEDLDSALPNGTSALVYRPTTNHAQSSKSRTDTAPTVAPTLVSTPLPTYAPNGSRDSWICNFDGCTQRIYGCSKPLGQQLITEHLEDHSKGREKVVGILWREQDKLHLPVNNLIKKIREMSEASTPLLPLAEGVKPVPARIERPT